MYIKNKTNSQIILAEVLAGKDLIIPANGNSQNFVPNKNLLNKFLLNQTRLELHVNSGHEINVATEIDPRVETLIVLD